MFQVRGTPAAAPRASGCTSVTPPFRRYQSQGYSTLRHTCSSTRSCSSVTSGSDSPRHACPCALAGHAEVKKGKASQYPHLVLLERIDRRVFRRHMLAWHIVKNTRQIILFSVDQFQIFTATLFSFFFFFALWRSLLKLSQSGMSECMKSFSRLRGGESLHAKVCRSFLIGSMSLCLCT